MHSRKRHLGFALFVVCIFGSAWAQQRLPTRHLPEDVRNGVVPQVGTLRGDSRLTLAIMLPLRNRVELDELIRELYDPQSPFYGRYLTVDNFTQRFGPTQEDHDAVMSFAASNGMTVTTTYPNRLVVEINATVTDIEKVFHLTMGLYQHPTENRTFYAPDREPSVDLAVPLWHIAGLNNFSLPQPGARAGAPAGGSGGSGSGPNGSFYGSDMRAAYYGGSALTGSNQAVGLMEFSAYNLSDVQMYFSKAGQSLNVPINNVLLGGFNGVCNSCNDSEAALDIEQAVSMAPGLSQVLVYEANPSSLGNGGDVTILNRMASDNIAKQLSCSWVWYPDDPSSDETIFQEFATQGQTFLTISGDWSSYPFKYVSSTVDCPDGCYYPAEDPYVTTVGGTDLTTTGPGGSWVSETAWKYSGGGISPDQLGIPLYQQLSGVINSPNQGSTTYRNVPDLAAQADYVNYIYYSGTSASNWGGTSFSAPRWAGFIALVNQNRVANGQSTIGFLNPTIYSVGLSSSYRNYFHDITTGNSDSGCCSNTVWYSAVAGYDLVTGWGSPVASGWLTTLSTTSSVVIYKGGICAYVCYPPPRGCVNSCTPGNAYFAVVSSTGFNVGDSVTVEGNSYAGANGTWTVLSIPSSTEIELSSSAPNGTRGAGGILIDNTF